MDPGGSQRPDRDLLENNLYAYIKPIDKPVKGYPGVKYEVPKASGKYTTKSIELHSPHWRGHKKWHWQKNTWHNRGIKGGPASNIASSKHWTLFGRRF